MQQSGEDWECNDWTYQLGCSCLSKQPVCQGEVRFFPRLTFFSKMNSLKLLNLSCVCSFSDLLRCHSPTDCSKFLFFRTLSTHLGTFLVLSDLFSLYLLDHDYELFAPFFSLLNPFQ